MKLKSRIGIAVSIGVMVVSSAMVIEVAQLVPTDKVIENAKSINGENAVEVTADIEPVDKNLVMASESTEQAAESNTEAVTVEAETEPVTEAETAVASEYDDKFMVNVEEYLNIRSGADENAEVLGKLYAGAGGTVLEKGDEWTKISSGSVEGYVATQYILFGADAEAKANEVGTRKATILEDSIRVRKAPSLEAGVWGLAEKDDVYTAYGTADGWVSVNYDGEIGYVALDYASVELVIGKAVSIEEELEQIRLEEERKQQEELEKQKKLEQAAAEEKKVAAESRFVETVQTSAYNVSEDDVYLLACLVHAEAGWEPYEGKLAVANVVLNRLNGGKYGNTISDVIYAKGQFSVAASGRLATVMAQGPNSESVTAAKEALAGVNNVPNYSNFRACSVANYSSYNNYSIIGTQVFFN